MARRSSTFQWRPGRSGYGTLPAAGAWVLQNARAISPQNLSTVLFHGNFSDNEDFLQAAIAVTDIAAMGITAAIHKMQGADGKRRDFIAINQDKLKYF